MKPAAFDYLRPDSLEEVLQALARHGEGARLVAGGQSLGAMLNMRLVEPELLIDIGRLAAADRIAREGSHLVVGAAATQAKLQELPGLARDVPLLHLALPWVGHYQTRNRGTVCGSIAHADPSAELPLCLVALGGEVELAAAGRHRRVPAADFFLGMLSTDRRPDEAVTAVRFPTAGTGTGYAFEEFGMRHGDFAIVAIAAVARRDGLRIAVGGVADRPVARDWPLLDGSALDDALNALAWELGASDDQHASARFRRDLVRRLGRRSLEKAMECRS
jgi:2-furoyl-CoA dehydrogenase FAD binding subunit